MGELYQDPSKAKNISQSFNGATGTPGVKTGYQNALASIGLSGGQNQQGDTAIDRRLKKQTSTD